MPAKDFRAGIQADGECEHGPEDDDLYPNKGCLAGMCGKDGKCVGTMSRTIFVPQQGLPCWHLRG
jgi:hypothetical protein